MSEIESSRSQLPFSKPFFLGIGGSGMSSLAHILIDLGMSVSGYDGKKSSVTAELEKKGARIYGRSDEIPESFDAAIYSSAVKIGSHPVASIFEKRNIPFYHRSQVLHDCFSHRIGIAVAGSHGKTTTAAMTSFLLDAIGMDPSVMVGGEVAFLGGKGGRFGSGEFAVFESDESDGTFLNHDAPVRILTNIDDDHLDYFKTRENLLAAFGKFVRKGTRRVILNLDDPGIRECLHSSDTKERIFGFTEISPDVWGKSAPSVASDSSVPYMLENGTLTFRYRGEEISFRSKFPGAHYLRNSLAAVMAGIEAGIPARRGAEVVSGYSGVKRRLEFIGSKSGVDVYDDYGHHPTEVRAVLASMREMSATGGKTIILFQPHRYTRTQNLYKEFAESLDTGDLVYLLPIYSAGEDPISGVGSELIAKSMKKKVKILSEDVREGCKELSLCLDKGDKLLTLGAGNVRDWGLQFLS